MKILLLLLGIQILFGCSKNLHHIIKKTNRTLPGQTAPSDMVFIPGNDSIQSFYIGVNEEPNINYVIYLKWLSAIYGNDYPELMINALPHKPNKEKTCSINDPYIKNYLTNPAFAYAPIVNLDWYQINNYLQWKTDVLNEEILIKNDILFFNIDQQSEPFVTEAFLCGQYQLGIKKLLESSNPNEASRKKLGTRTPSINDGILFLGFRLPTEQEWEYASKPQFAAIPKKEGTKSKYLYQDYGKEYFTFKWGRMFKTSGGYYSSFPESIKSYSMDNDFYEGLPKYRIDTSVKYVRDFSQEKYGIINMQGGVSEFLLDEYTEKVIYSDFKTIMKNSGFNVDSAALWSFDTKRQGDSIIKFELVNQYKEKNNYGRMQNFIFLGQDLNGNPNEISPLPIDSLVRNRVVKGGNNCSPSSNRTFMAENEWSPNVGFRCVLMYSGAPVLKGYKVQWK